MFNKTQQDETKPFIPLSVRLHIDVPLLLALATLATIGMILLYSATGENIVAVDKQSARLILAIIVLVFTAHIPVHQLRLLAPWLFILGIILLIAVLLFGSVGKGAQRWIDFGFFRFQPSEIMKLAVPLMAASFLAKTELPPPISRVLIATVMVIVPTLLIAKQPDLGTALLVASSGIFVIFLAGISWVVIAGVMAVGVASVPLLWSVMHNYQKQRVLTFLNPESDPLGSGYHIIQSKIAIGSGGIYGKGWLNGTQSQLQFLPERHTDFIFAVLAEEFGLYGVLFLFTIYMFIVFRGLQIALQGRDNFSRLLAGSITLTFFIYFFVNVGMVSGFFPVVGLPLPIVSYGGTSLVTLAAAFGILMAIRTDQFSLGGRKG